MPRHDCFEIDYSLGGPALVSNCGGACWVGTKQKGKKENVVLEQIVAKSNFLLQLLSHSFSASFIFSLLRFFLSFFLSCPFYVLSSSTDGIPDVG